MCHLFDEDNYTAASVRGAALPAALAGGGKNDPKRSQCKHWQVIKQARAKCVRTCVVCT